MKSLCSTNGFFIYLIFHFPPYSFKQGVFQNVVLLFSPKSNIHSILICPPPNAMNVVVPNFTVRAPLASQMLGDPTFRFFIDDMLYFSRPAAMVLIFSLLQCRYHVSLVAAWDADGTVQWPRDFQFLNTGFGKGWGSSSVNRCCHTQPTASFHHDISWDFFLKAN